MIATPLPRLRHLACRFLAAARAWVARWTRPAPLTVAVGVAADATRNRSELWAGCTTTIGAPPERRRIRTMIAG